MLGQPQFDPLVREEAELADLDTTRYVHSNRYVDGLEAARPDAGYVYLDGGDTMMEPSTWEVVLRGVGATVQAVDKVLNWGGAERLRRVPPAGPPRRNRTGHGVLPVQQHQHRRATRAA